MMLVLDRILQRNRVNRICVCGQIDMLCCAKSLQLCLTLCNSMDYSPPDSSVHVIIQARILEWGAMFSSRGSSPPRNQTQISYVSCIGKQLLYHQHHLGSPRQIGRQIYFKELAHVTKKASKSKICTVVQQAGNPGRASVAV